MIAWPFPSSPRPIVETPPGWITLPVLLGHDTARPIGMVRLQASQLPKTPEWCLSLAYTSPPIVRRDRPTVGAYQPEAFGLTLQPAAPVEASQPWIAEALRLAGYWHRCHVEFSTVGDLDAARAALEAHLRAAAPAEGVQPVACEADVLRIADKHGQRWKAPDEEGISFEKSAFFDFATELLAAPQAEAAGVPPMRAPAAPVQVDREMVICPGCCHQFRAIPEAVQRLLLDAGIEAPFTAAGGQR